MRGGHAAYRDAAGFEASCRPGCPHRAGGSTNGITFTDPHRALCRARVDVKEQERNAWQSAPFTLYGVTKLVTEGDKGCHRGRKFDNQMGVFRVRLCLRIRFRRRGLGEQRGGNQVYQSLARAIGGGSGLGVLNPRLTRLEPRGAPVVLLIGRWKRGFSSSGLRPEGKMERGAGITSR